ncbi:hypothetical protein F7725_005603 [Dissostichus mawsoni]|uniref:Phosphatidic acid phosphatase type 2/haloperoxidase domain-containing protein n=1 Tax=Dissostichus mawsoni TaxID=36200 RepID=A0A7J5YVV9_DISMA|nr:hypothetical protein F7725_005603 [Dissostichus mawsoni]
MQVISGRCPRAFHGIRTDFDEVDCGNPFLIQWRATEARGWFCFERDEKGKRERSGTETTTQLQNGSPLQEQILLETQTWRSIGHISRSTAYNKQRFKMIDSQLSAQRRAMRSLPDDSMMKTSTYIVPCFLLVECQGWEIPDCQLRVVEPPPPPPPLRSFLMPCWLRLTVAQRASTSSFAPIMNSILKESDLLFPTTKLFLAACAHIIHNPCWVCYCLSSSSSSVQREKVTQHDDFLKCCQPTSLVIMAGTVLLAYYFEYTDTFPVHIQGFFCFDKAYSKPFRDQRTTARHRLSSSTPYLCFGSEIVLITAEYCESEAERDEERGSERVRETEALGKYAVSFSGSVKILIGEVTSFFVKAEGAQEKTIVTADCCYFNPLLRRIVRFLGVYSFGLFTTTIFANAGQVVTGNQTPHFLSACKPNYTALGCQSPLHYIAERRACTGNPYLVASARKSFPSKDAALSFYSAIYTVMYVTLVFRTKGTRLTKPTLCLVLLSLAVLVGVVRVTEHRNHWNDVLAGFITGGAIAAFLDSMTMERGGKNAEREQCVGVMWVQERWWEDELMNKASLKEPYCLCDRGITHTITSMNVSCVINNFEQTQISMPSPPPHQRPEPPIGIPLLSLPRVESPLEKLSGLQGYRILRSHDHQPIPSPTPPDVLLPSRRCLTSAV